LYFCGLEKENQGPVCQPTLLEHASKSLKTFDSLASLQSFCATLEGEQSLKAKNKDFISLMYDTIRRTTPDSSALNRLNILFTLLRPYLLENDIEQYDKLAIGQLQQHLLMHADDDLQKIISDLRSSGFPLKRIEEVLSPQLQKLEKKWETFVETSCKAFSCTDSDSLTVEVSSASEQLQQLLSSDMEELLSLLSFLPDNIQMAIKCRAISSQGKAVLDFSARAMQAGMALVAQAELTQEECEATLAWLEKLHADIIKYQSSSMAKDLNAMNRLAAQIATTIKTTESKLIEIKKNPQQHRSRSQRAVDTTLKVARLAMRTLTWLPFTLLYILPIAIATYAGYKAEGSRGALFSAGVATTTTVLSAFAASIASKTAEELTKMPGIPDTLRPTVGSILGFSLQMMCVLLSMQVNGFLAGSLSTMTLSAPKEDPTTRPWYPRRLWNASGRVKDSVANFTLGIPSFIKSEYGIASSAICSPQHYGAVFGRISNVVQAQIEATVEGYHFGQASTELPIATFNLLGTIAGS
jgi:DNA-binding transcriptional MerR regulator